MIAALLRTIAGTGLIFLLLCFIVSGVNEWIAVVRGTRGKFLKLGIRRLLPDPPIFRRVMQHPLISGMSRDAAKLGRSASHLAPANFAGSLIEVISRRAGAAGWVPTGDRMKDLEGAANAVRLDHPLIIQTITSVYDRGGGDYERAVAGVEAWFESSMRRVRGWYVGFTRVRIFWLAFLFAAIANVDTVRVVQAFWYDARPEATQSAPAARQAWPIGYACLSDRQGIVGSRVQTCANRLTALPFEPGGLIWMLSVLIGWLITATAVAIASPYFYRLLTKVGN
jgi:hypothetical protein